MALCRVFNALPSVFCRVLDKIAVLGSDRGRRKSSRQLLYMITRQQFLDLNLCSLVLKNTTTGKNMEPYCLVYKIDCRTESTYLANRQKCSMKRIKFISHAQTRAGVVRPRCQLLPILHIFLCKSKANNLIIDWCAPLLQRGYFTSIDNGFFSSVTLGREVSVNYTSATVFLSNTFCRTLDKDMSFGTAALPARLVQHADWSMWPALHKRQPNFDG